LGHNSHAEEKTAWTQLWGETAFRYREKKTNGVNEQWYLPLIKAMPMGTLLNMDLVGTFGDGVQQGARDLRYA